MDYKLEKFEKHSDQRGELIVFLKHSELSEAKKTFGQIYFVTFNDENVVRGNHYHKKWFEWFGIVAGKVEVTLVDVNTQEKETFILNSEQDKYMRLEIGPNVAHVFKSLSNYAALVNYADGEWSAEDSFHYKII